MEINKRPCNPLLHIFLLLQLEDMLYRGQRSDICTLHTHTYQVELLLQLLIGIIYAELLKTIFLKHFKTINIQYPNGGVALQTRGEGVVQLRHHPIKEMGIEMFS